MARTVPFVASALVLALLAPVALAQPFHPQHKQPAPPLQKLPQQGLQPLQVKLNALPQAQPRPVIQQQPIIQQQPFIQQQPVYNNTLPPVQYQVLQPLPNLTNVPSTGIAFNPYLQQRLNYNALPAFNPYLTNAYTNPLLTNAYNNPFVTSAYTNPFLNTLNPYTNPLQTTLNPYTNPLLTTAYNPYNFNLFNNPLNQNPFNAVYNPFLATNPYSNLLNSQLNPWAAQSLFAQSLWSPSLNGFGGINVSNSFGSNPNYNLLLNGVNLGLPALAGGVFTGSPLRIVP